MIKLLLIDLLQHNDWPKLYTRAHTFIPQLSISEMILVQEDISTLQYLYLFVMAMESFPDLIMSDGLLK